MKPSSILLGLCLLTSTTSLAFASTAYFNDVQEGAWYADSVNHLAELNILQGDPDGSYRPDDTVNRAELAVVLDRLLEYVEEGKVSDEAPLSLELDVPFTSQAPDGDWSMPYQEACEEAALAMVNAYLNGETLNVSSADSEILAILEWEDDQGYGVDVGTEEISIMAKEIYGLDSTIYTDDEVSVYSIKAFLAAGYPVILPTQGTALNNPNFIGDGPPYHMIVLVGYNEEGFIAHDPGTHLGESYVYPYDTIEKAIHDWTGSRSTIEEGRQAMVVLSL